MGTLVTVASIAIHHLLESVHGWNSSSGISKAMRMHHWIDFHKCLMVYRSSQNSLKYLNFSRANKKPTWCKEISEEFHSLGLHEAQCPWQWKSAATGPAWKMHQRGFSPPQGSLRVVRQASCAWHMHPLEDYRIIISLHISPQSFQKKQHGCHVGSYDLTVSVSTLWWTGKMLSASTTLQACDFPWERFRWQPGMETKNSNRTGLSWDVSCAPTVGSFVILCLSGSNWVQKHWLSPKVISMNGKLLMEFGWRFCSFTWYQTLCSEKGQGPDPAN